MSTAPWAFPGWRSYWARKKKNPRRALQAKDRSRRIMARRGLRCTGARARRRHGHSRRGPGLHKFLPNGHHCRPNSLIRRTAIASGGPLVAAAKRSCETLAVGRRCQCCSILGRRAARRWRQVVENPAREQTGSLASAGRRHRVWQASRGRPVEAGRRSTASRRQSGSQARGPKLGVPSSGISRASATSSQGCACAPAPRTTCSS